jgi:hypothetical protein
MLRVCVREHPDGPVVGFVEAASLKGGRVRDHRQDIKAEHLLSDATPLSSLLQALTHRLRAFILVGPQVEGIVTQADLNKPPVRAYLLGLVSLLEMHLSFWVVTGYPGDSWRAALKADRIDAANRVLAERVKRNPKVTLFECLQFCDKRVLLVAQEELRTKLGLPSKSRAKSLLEHAEDLRNGLAHSQLDLAQGASWTAVLEQVEAIETAVHASDDAVQKRVSRLHAKDREGLWV